MIYSPNGIDIYIDGVLLEDILLDIVNIIY